MFLSAASARAQRSTPLQLLHPAPTANDQFGQALAISGDTMVVGSAQDDVGFQFDQGSAHIYRWTGSGWAFEATLTAADGLASDNFGSSVAIHGDTVIVGASMDDGAASDQGSAYIFVRAGATWTQQQKLTAFDAAVVDQFGRSVAIFGDTVVVGAPYDNVGAIVDQGSAYVFTRAAGGSAWTLQQKLTASDGASPDLFGFSVAISGDSILIAAVQDTVGANSTQGSAYVFTRVGAAWTQQQKLTAADGAALDNFGSAVAISGDTALVGAYLDDVSAISNTGSAYIFTRTDTVWTQQAQLRASDAAADDGFGYSVALDGGTAIVGAIGDDIGATSNQGSAYVFTRAGTAWTQQAQLLAPDGAAGDSAGASVAIFGDTAAVGAPSDDVGAGVNHGSAWAFSRIGSSWIGPDLKVIGFDGAAGDGFGISVAISGDTAVVGAIYDTLGASFYQGSAYIFVRTGTTWTQQAKVTASDGAGDDHFGISVAIWGDTAVVGAYSDDVGANSDQGSAYIFVRAGTTWTQQAKLTASDGVAGDGLGISVAISGDTAVVGARYDDVGANTNQGSAYIFVRVGTTWTQQAKLTASDGAAFDDFGYSVAISGDTVVVGANSDNVGANSAQGSAYIFVRAGMTWTQQAKLTASDGAAVDYYGISVAISGDTMVVGAQYDDVGANSDQGSAYIFVRAGTTWTQQAKLTASDGAAGDYFGISVAISGDTAVVGADSDDVGANSNQGSAYIFVRAGTTWTQQPKVTASDGAAGDLFGLSVAISADTTVVGAYGDDVGANSDQGSASVFQAPSNDFTRARNDALDQSYPTLGAALLSAQSGHQLSGTQAAWRFLTNLDTAGRSLILRSEGDLRTASTSIITLGGSSSLNVNPGELLEIDGQLRASGYADLYADSFFLGSRAILTARTGSSLTINAPAADLQGQTRLEQGSALTFGGTATAIGPVTAFLNSSLTAAGTFTNIDTFTITSGTISVPLFYNRAAANIFGSSAIFGSYANEAGAITTIRSGTLFVFGSLTNNGTIIGTICSNCLGGPPNIDIGDSLILGPAATLTMPYPGATVHIGGSFDCAINASTRFDLSVAAVQLEGAAPERTMEVLSTDIGPLPQGLDRTIAGHYPVGTLEIGPSPTTVRLVDARDNDTLGQAPCEALYVNTLRIHPGSHLINPSCRIYYSTLINAGTVDVPTNLIPIAPACSADFNGDGDIGTDQDIEAFFRCLAGVCCPTCGSADFNNDGDIGTDQDIEAFFRVLAGGSC